MSASANTTFGDLPPSSSVTFFRLPVAAPMMRLPTAVEPVKAILSTRRSTAVAVMFLHAVAFTPHDRGGRDGPIVDISRYAAVGAEQAGNRLYRDPSPDALLKKPCLAAAGKDGSENDLSRSPITRQSRARTMHSSERRCATGSTVARMLSTVAEFLAWVPQL